MEFYSIQILFLIINSAFSLSTECESKIYCDGDILDAIQTAEIFKDSKTFVDMPMRHSENDIIQNFKKINKSVKNELKKFVFNNFYPSGYDTTEAFLDEWQPDPPYLKKLPSKLADFAKDLHNRWQHLFRKFETLFSGFTTSALSDRNSSFRFVVPGGRFREFYYWDSYWIIEGLLISGMHETAKEMISYFLSMVDKYDFVPNGARVYYLNRSQPPLLIQMVYAYHKRTNDSDFVTKNINLLEKEYQFWEKERKNKKFNLNYYNVKNTKPRPESYKEDKINGNISEFYANVASAAESGWDFSSRWFADAQEIKTIQTNQIIPVDLNCILYRNEIIMQKFYDQILNEKEKSEEYKNNSIARKRAVEEVLWNSKSGIYRDFNFKVNSSQSRNLYISDLAPLWSGMMDKNDSRIPGILKIYSDLLNKYPSGIPISNVTSREQWDFPKVWAPYQHWMVEFYLETNRTKEALGLAQRFLNTVYCSWSKNKAIYEKYDADNLGQSASGGEYDVQEGFGWTNGVVIIFMEKFDSQLGLPNCTTQDSNSSKISRSNAKLVFLLFLVLRFFF